MAAGKVVVGWCACAALLAACGSGEGPKGGAPGSGGTAADVPRLAAGGGAGAATDATLERPPRTPSEEDPVQLPPTQAPLEPPPKCRGVIEFPDPTLEALVRDRAGGLTGQIHFDDLQRIQVLAAADVPIETLEGLQCLTNLEEVTLVRTFVSDLAPVGGLPKLQTLLVNEALVRDVSPLASAASLVQLRLIDNQISDLSALADLPRLEILYVDNNRIRELSPLQGVRTLRMLYAGHNLINRLDPLSQLVGLTHLYLGGNALVDLSPLAKLPQLTYVALQSNQVSNIAPIAANTMLAEGDYVHLTGNPIDCDDPETRTALDTILARGGWIHVDCASVLPF